MKFVLISKVVRNFVEQKEFSANDIDAIADEVLDGESVHMAYYKDSARQSTGEVSLLDALDQEGRVEEVRKAVFIAIEKHENLLAQSSPKEISKLEEIDFVYDNALCSAIRNDDSFLIANLLQKSNQRLRLMYLEDNTLFDLKAKDLDFVLTELSKGQTEAAEDVNISAPLLLINATIAESSVGIIKVLKKHAKKTKNISSFVKPLRSLFDSWHVKPIASALCSIKECIEHKDIESKKLFWKEVNDRVAYKDRIYISTNYDTKWGGELMSIRDKVPEIDTRYIDYNTFIGFMILGVKKEYSMIVRSFGPEKRIDELTKYYMNFEPLIDKKTISGLDKINTQLIKEFSEEIKKVIENLILKLSLESISLQKPRNSL